MRDSTGTHAHRVGPLVTRSDPQILVVDDNEDVLTMLQQSLSRHGFSIDTASSAQAALERVATVRYDAALLDLVMPGQDGVALAEALRELAPGLLVAVLTGYSHSPLLRSARKSGVAVFTKPVPMQELVDYLKEAIG